MKLLCHSDTWNFIWYWAPGGLPDRAKESGMVEVGLSGPQIVKILTAMGRVRFVGGTSTRAIAKRVYTAMAEVIDEIDPSADPGKPIPPIVIDDKVREA